MKQKITAVFIPVFFILLLFFSCEVKKEPAIKEPSSDEILNADIAFSDMSRQLGMKKAFLEYLDNNGVLLRPGHKPLVGADAIDFLTLINDSAYTLTWKPEKAAIARSGDLGFTYGIYELRSKDTTLKGTYVSIWKKQNDGEWKLVLDSGNEGLSP